AGAGAGVVPRLHGRVLGFDAGLARGRAAGAGLAQSQARRPCPRRPLILARLKREDPKREDRLKAAGLVGGSGEFGVAINSPPLARACSTRRRVRARSIYIRRRRAGIPTPRLRARRTSPCRRHREYWACG